MLSVGSLSALAAMAVVALTIVLAWFAAYAAGGSRTVAPHLFYLPVVFAAARFGRVAAAVTAVAAGITAGPLLPLDVVEATAQQPINWILRMVAFVAVAEAVAFFVHHSRGPIGDDAARVVVRRDLRRALDSGHLHVVFQPIVALESGRTVGAEALVRWSDPDRGDLSPASFIPAAEAAGVVHLVSEFVLGEVAVHLGVWRSHGLVVRDQEFKLAINISGSELRDDRLESLVRDLIVRERVPGEWINLEVTETAIIDDLDRAIHGLQRLRGIGVRLAIDDFGTGEATLRYLHRLPVSVLKIDRTFIQPLVEDERGRHIVQAVVELAHHMKLRTVAEGVESAETADILREMGCDLAQGYHFAAPMDPRNFEEHLRREAESHHR